MKWFFALFSFLKNINGDMEVSVVGLSLIKKWEKFRSKAYKPTPDDRWTIGWGTTFIDGIAVQPGQVCTLEQANKWFETDVRNFQKQIRKLVTVELNQNQWDALVSFTYNVGVGNLAKSSLLKKINSKQFTECPKEFRKWIKSGGKILSGLIKRRESEQWLFSCPTTTPVEEICKYLEF